MVSGLSQRPHSARDKAAAVQEIEGLWPSGFEIVSFMILIVPPYKVNRFWQGEGDASGSSG